MTDPKHVLKNAEHDLKNIETVTAAVTPYNYTQSLRGALSLLGSLLKRTRNMRAELNRLRVRENNRIDAWLVMRTLPEGERLPWLLEARGKMGQQRRELAGALGSVQMEWPALLEQVRALRNESRNWATIEEWCRSSIYYTVNFSDWDPDNAPGYTGLRLCCSGKVITAAFTGPRVEAVAKAAAWIREQGKNHGDT